jgi:hypothetical protein
MSTDFRSLCAELLRAWQFGDDIAGPMNRARAELAKPEPVNPPMPVPGDAEGLAEVFWGRYDQPEPVAPTDEEIDALERDHWQSTGVVNESLQQEELFNYRAFLRAGLSRWGRPATQPVPVSERPWEREGWCDAEGQCWLRRKHEEDGVTWRLMAPASVFDDAMPIYYAEALPHHALPTPEATNA